MNISAKEITGYPSIDKPWLKYYNNDYSDEISTDCSMVDYLYKNAYENMNYMVFNYFRNKISFERMFDYINKTASSLYSLGVEKGEIISVCGFKTPETVWLLYAINKVEAVCNMIGISSSVLR